MPFPLDDKKQGFVRDEAGLPPGFSGWRPRFFAFCGPFPRCQMCRSLHLSNRQVDESPKRVNFKPSRYKGVVRPFLETASAGKPGRFSASPLSHSPLKYFTSWERTRYASLLTSRKPSFRQQPRKDEQNHEHRYRPWLLRHQDPAFFFPSRYHRLFP